MSRIECWSHPSPKYVLIEAIICSTCGRDAVPVKVPELPVEICEDHIREGRVFCGDCKARGNAILFSQAVSA